MIKLYKNDLTTHLDIGRSVAIDTETLGLNPLRDRLCLLQEYFLTQFELLIRQYRASGEGKDRQQQYA